MSILYFNKNYGFRRMRRNLLQFYSLPPLKGGKNFFMHFIKIDYYKDFEIKVSIAIFIKNGKM